ncbi:YdeI/OmpD-associated family protein [Flagellimonas sp.]|uniref:YdeI/OmpD-associated family protein n=1 Tax=Flagellimonas sp. TaxID=2058762 RepID=UPI003B52773B
MESPVFEVSLESTHSVRVPTEVVAPFLEAGHKRVKVKAFFENKEAVYYAALQKRIGAYFVMFNKGNQKNLGVYPGDYFQMQFFEDTSKYGVEMPEELEAVLSTDMDAETVFESFTDGKKRSLIYMISGYKNSQTRIDKSLLLCENLKRGIRDNKLLLKPL